MFGVAPPLTLGHKIIRGVGSATGLTPGDDIAAPRSGSQPMEALEPPHRAPPFAALQMRAYDIGLVSSVCM